MALTPGARLGPYEIVEPLGAGGMGEVYRARDPRIGREVALKVLHTQGGADAERIRRFEQEARAAGVLNHPNILTVHDVGAADGQPYLVCELLEGGSLRERLSRGPLAPERVVDIGIQVARGLAAAHAKGVVHRDLKPENLFLTRDGRVKILDFGIAKLVEREPGGVEGLTTAPGTAAGVIIGTAAYMSPEQVAARPVDPRSDLFSLGVVLHELLSGTSPFARPTAVETMTAVLNTEPPPLSTGDGRVTPALDRIVRHCLEKSPDDRFQSARDLGFALESLGTATGSTGAATVPSGTPRPAARARVPWWWLPVAAATAAALVWLVRPTPAVDDTPRFRRVVKLVATEAIESSPVLSPDGKWVAYISNEGGRNHVWVRYLAGGRSINLTAGAPDLFVSSIREVSGLDISPDGSQIAFPAGPTPGSMANTQSTYVVPAPLGGTPRKLLERAMGIRWSQDGRRLATVVPGGSAGDSIAVADANGENLRIVRQASGGLHTHWPAWSADGKYVYFSRSTVSANAEPTEAIRIPADGGPDDVVVPTTRRALFPYPSRDGRGMVYSANPDGVELALWWKPWDGEPRRLTTGVGEYAEARLSADGRSMVATAYETRQSLAMLPVDGRPAAVVRLTAGSTGDIDPAMSPSGDRLAVSSTRSGDRNIWTMRPDGSDARQVTAGSAIDERPAWSPDGMTIAFVSSRGGERGIWVVASDGGAPRRVVVANVHSTITWSPDGRELVYSAPAGASPGLFRVGVDGGAPSPLSTPVAASAPHWSAPSNLIAYVASVRTAVRATGMTRGNTWVALLRPSGEAVERPLEPTLANGTIAWSPDGRFLAGLHIPGGAAAAIWVIPAEGSAPTRPLIEFGLEERPRGITWSADGRHVIFGLTERTADIVLFDNGS